MTEVLKQRMARAIAAAIYSSQHDVESASGHSVMAERRRKAEDAAAAALAVIEPGDDLGRGMAAASVREGEVTA